MTGPHAEGLPGAFARAGCAPGPPQIARMTVSVRDLLGDLQAYVAAGAREAAMRDRTIAFLNAYGERAFERTLTTGHITASAWVLDPERTRAVLLHHRKLDRWLQLGGHVDGDPDVRRAALREAREESGLRTLRLIIDDIYDVDVHPIPERGNEPRHDHYDIRFALEADPREPLVRNAESHDVRWISLTDLETYTIDDSVRRLAAKSAVLPA
jgi:8-oxo-dGTP pyrophosphatase MutT (NUDIX family)